MIYRSENPDLPSPTSDPSYAPTVETTARTRRSAGGALALAALLLGGLTACGTEPEALAAAGRVGLHEQVETIRDAVDENRPAAAEAAVDDFRAAVHRLVSDGDLARDDGLVLLAQVDQIASRLPAELPAPVTTARPGAESGAGTQDEAAQPDEDEDGRADDSDDSDRGDRSRGDRDRDDRDRDDRNGWGKKAKGGDDDQRKGKKRHGNDG